MTPNPILKVLSTLKKHHVKCLLIGGQACIVYGAAEFSRDSDFIILCTAKNLEFLKKALNSLNAELIYVPQLEKKYLEKGHACHFRCMAKEVKNLRIDVISKLRGCEPFDKLWERRSRIIFKDGHSIDVINLRDLVQSKKTQRDKDWLMLKRLVENDIILHKDNPSKAQLRWWFCESRNVARLIELAKEYPETAKKCVAERVLLSYAIKVNVKKLERQLQKEELVEREKDIEYWSLLKKELEILRQQRIKKEKIKI